MRANNTEGHRQIKLFPAAFYAAYFERDFEMTEAKRGRGRPPKAQGERRRHNQTFRCTDALREALETSAEENQRSISEEVEYRLMSSLEDDQERKDKLRNPSKGIRSEWIRGLNTGMDLLEGYVGQDWPDNDVACISMYYMTCSLADHYFKPKPKNEWSKADDRAINEALDASDTVIKALTWNAQTEPPINRLAHYATPHVRSAKEAFASRKDLAEKLKAADAEKKVNA